jgi:hypothetical protein
MAPGQRKPGSPAGHPVFVVDRDAGSSRVTRSDRQPLPDGTELDGNGAKGAPSAPTMAGGHKQLGWSIELGHVVLLESPNPIETMVKGGEVDVAKRIGDHDSADEIGGQVRQVFGRPAPITAKNSGYGPLASRYGVSPIRRSKIHPSQPASVEVGQTPPTIARRPHGRSRWPPQNHQPRPAVPPRVVHLGVGSYPLLPCGDIRAGCRNRTDDLCFTRAALCQLS